MIKRLFLTVLFCFWLAPASAQVIPNYKYRYASAPASKFWVAPQAACQAWFDTFTPDDKSYYGDGVKAMLNETSCNTRANDYYTPIQKVIGGCPSGYSLGSDYICRMVQCPDPTWVRDVELNCVPPVPLPCPSGMIDGGVDAQNKRICTVQVCNSPGVLQSNGSCRMPDGTTTGSTGATGPAGPVGATGAAGAPGAVGATGPAGGVGPSGADGSAGAVGATGAGGAPGAVGATGLTGATGSAGPVGPSGSNGATGALGGPGASGASGINGTNGLAGSNGVNGATGPMGATGMAGVTGVAGAPGVAGIAGTNGLDGKSLCEANPGLSVCKNSSVNGSCGSITCDGDAIQCATLRAAAAMRCAQEADKADLAASSQKTLGDAILNGVDPEGQKIADHMKGDEVDVSNAHLDSSGFLGGGACFPASSFTVAGQTVVVDMSAICDKISPLRYVVMSCAALISYLIIAKSILGS